MAKQEYENTYVTGNFIQLMQELAEKIGKPQLKGKIGSMTINGDSVYILFIK